MLYQEKANFCLLMSLFAVLIALYFIPVNSIDGDSSVYSKITTELARRPFKELFAVKWYGYCKFYEASSIFAEYFYEHPPGLFFLPWLIAQLGFPAHNVLFAVDIIFQICCFFLFINLGRRFLPGAYAYLVPFMLLFMPIAFQYNVRGNHETPLLFYFLLSFFIVSSEHQKIWHLPILVFAFANLIFLKGTIALASFLAVFVTAMVSWRLRQGSFSLFIKSKLCFFILIALSLSTLCAVVFEWIHFKITGNSFWTYNLHLQIFTGAARAASNSWWLLRKVHNLGFYLSMLTWYSFPYVILQAYRLLNWRRNPSHRDGCSLTQGQWLEWRIIMISILLCSGIYLFGLSISDRLAQRYIYPVYWIGGFAAAASLVMSSKRVRDLSDTWIGENSSSLLWIFWGSFRVTAIVFKWL